MAQVTNSGATFSYFLPSYVLLPANLDKCHLCVVVVVNVVVVEGVVAVVVNVVAVQGNHWKG